MLNLQFEGQMRTAGALALLLALLAATRASDWAPHVPPGPARPSWFEGWFLRVTPLAPANAHISSFALIIGHLPHGRPGWYTSLVQMQLQATDAGAPLVVANTSMVLQVQVPSGGGPPTHDPRPASPPRFAVVSAGSEALRLVVDGDSCSLRARLPGGLSISIDCAGPPLEYGPGGESPEGAAAALPEPLVSLHWAVRSLATCVAFQLRRPGRLPLSGAGLAHLEGNWGRRFPAAWHWAQGVAPAACPTAAADAHPGASAGAVSGDAHPACTSVGAAAATAAAGASAFVLVGSKVPSGLVPECLSPRLWLLGVWSAGRRHERRRRRRPCPAKRAAMLPLCGEGSSCAHARLATPEVCLALDPAPGGPLSTHMTPSFTLRRTTALAMWQSAPTSRSAGAGCTYALRRRHPRSARHCCARRLPATLAAVLPGCCHD